MAGPAIGIASLVTLVLGSSVTSSILTIAGNALLSRLSEGRRKRRAQAYAALRIAVALEEFAGRCAELIESYSMRGQPYGGPDRLPPFPAFAPDIDWQSLDLVLASKTLSLENVARLANHSLSSSAQNFTEGTAEVECRDYCAELGFEAWTLAARLRAAHRIGDLPLGLTWNYPRLLEREAEDLRERRAKFREEQLSPSAQAS